MPDIAKMYAPPTAAIDDAPVVPYRGRDSLGWALLATPIVAGLALVIVNVSFAAGSWAPTFVSLGMIVVTSVLAAIDARRWHLHRPGIVGMLLLWLVFYPRYFVKRSARGAPRLFLLSLAAIALYFAIPIAFFLLRSR